ncbi:hypothetical protein E4U22_000940 [Claviceps purpurea]|uniref:Rasp f 7 allergen n=1 Tax=Claviceps purpurea (strain 20.1) TaxID=1111077 RepID=M1VVW3_CLAP2|nr:hypothetical protein E4U38_006330 [Claviceps purpurea]CCE30222.1 uncharacterized protein CPUR_04070 [Claviceps purpurea 20.1]KAG6137083.1 hypothetical protein E4U12_000855 [Claviceps purpurea]KAG6149234.1 hypothetical protein E4U37_006929 [Claviceps purpurea]KAG6152930.1 hypothetical protein E4U11_007221 [Claviceps purpurea]
MKFQAVTTFLVAALPAVLAVDYTLTCARTMVAGNRTDEQTLASFTNLYENICLSFFGCALTSPPTLSAGGVVVDGICVGCKVDLAENAFDNCVLAPVPDT